MIFCVLVGLAVAGPASTISSGTNPAPQSAADVEDMRRQLKAEIEMLDQQQRQLDAAKVRIEQLEAKLGGRPVGSEATQAVATAQQTGEVPLSKAPPPAPPPAPLSSGIQTVGQAPTDQRQVQVAVLDQQGGVITKKGRLTLEGDLDYTHTDNSSVIFRGTAALPAVLIGIFDINQSRDDVVTASAVARLGVTNRFELNAQLPFVYRSDRTVLAPVQDPSTPTPGQVDHPVQKAGLGDIGFGARYQVTDGHNGSPYLIVGLQAIAPSGTNPFTVPRDGLGNELKPSTGSGFWGLTPNITAILPTDPAVIFGTLGYTYNLPRSIDAIIGSSRIRRVAPGGEPSASVGLAIQLNPRTSLSLGYAHTMVLGTKTRFEAMDATTGQYGPLQVNKTRDLQLGRLLFGVSYRTNARTTINWSMEAGVTQDAPDIRTTLRVPLALDIF